MFNHLNLLVRKWCKSPFTYICNYTKNSISLKNYHKHNKTTPKLYTKDYKTHINHTQHYTATIKQDNQPIPSKTITFTLNNHQYLRKTNNHGTATLQLNLNEGEYNITTRYDKITNHNIIIIQSKP